MTRFLPQFGLSIALLFCGMLSAQITGGGNINGTVRDTTGAVIPNASLSLTSDSGVTLHSQSNSAGLYAFPGLMVGKYKLAITSPGFATLTVTQIDVEVNQTTTKDVSLSPGSVSANVTVLGDAPHLDTTTSAISTVLDQETFTSLPIALSGGPRSPTMLADLMPGVADTTQPGAPGNQIVALSFSGGQFLTGDVVYDGLPLGQTNIAGDYRSQPVPVDALSEINVLQNNFSAEYSNSPGGIMVFNTKSGGEKWHGEAYEFNKNTALNALGYWYTPGAAVPPLHQNEFGISAGGPLRAGKTFIFAYYSGFRFVARTTTQYVTIPTLAERSGDFSAYVNGSGSVIPIYDPATTSCDASGNCTRTQFSYNGQLNVIPPSRIVAPAKAYMSYMPTPTFSGLTKNFASSNFPTTTTEDRYGVKLDQYFGDKDRVHGFFGMSPLSSDEYVTTPVYASPFNDIILLPNNFALTRINYDHTFNSSLINQLAIGYNRDNSSFMPPDANAGVTLGISNIGNNAPLIQDGYVYQGAAGEEVVENSYGYGDMLIWNKGAHAIKVGGDLRWIQLNDQPVSQATLNFGGTETAQPTNYTVTGNSLASLELGLVDSAQMHDYVYRYDSRYHSMSYYAQDDWRIFRKLTLNLGLHYDVFFPLVRADNIYSTLDPTMPNPGAGGILGALAFAGNGSTPYCNCTRFAPTHYNEWQPRFGFAYSVNDKTVVRGAFGSFSAPTGNVSAEGVRDYYGDGFNASPYFATQNLGVTPAFNLTDGFPSYTPPPFISPTYDNNGVIDAILPADSKSAQIVSWSAGVQRSLPYHFMLDVSYVGNLAHHLGSKINNLNQVDPKYLSLGNYLSIPLNTTAGLSTGVAMPYPGFAGTVAQALHPFPQYEYVTHYLETDGSSSYNSLQVKLQREYGKNLSVLFSYTYAQNMTDGESAQAWDEPSLGSQNSYDKKAEWSASTAVPPQIASIAYVYTLPLGHGQRFLNHGITGAIVGGWSLSGIDHYQTGVPIVVEIGNTLLLANYTLRPNLVPGQSIKKPYSGKFNGKTGVFLNAAAFAPPADFTFGNAPRTLANARSFAFYNEDISLGRHFAIPWREGDLSVGVNAFNMFNRVMFGGLNTGTPWNNAGFGTVSGQANSQRNLQIQAGLRF